MLRARAVHKFVPTIYIVDAEIFEGLARILRKHFPLTLVGRLHKEKKEGESH